MKTWIAFLRGINVGGAGRLPMAELVAILEEIGCSDVKTYIQSGNAVFRHAKTTSAQLSREIGEEIAKAHGFRPRVMVLGADQVAKAARANPFRKAEAEPGFLHLFFLSAKPDKAKLAALEPIRAKDEAFALEGDVLYLHTPGGFGVSKLAARAEKLLGVDATARNWNTVQAVLALAAKS